MFNFTYAPGTTLQQMLGFEIAGRVWDAYLNDTVTINLHVGIASSSTLPAKVIGGALPGMRANQSYSDLRNRLSADRKSSDDFTAVSNLGQTDNVWFDKWYYDSAGNGTYQGFAVSNTSANLTRANAKALGYSFTDANALDGYMMFSDLAGAPVTWSYDYTRSSTASSTTLDFLTAVVHEIGHVLGFVSGIDRPGWLYNVYDQRYGFLNTDKQQFEAMTLSQFQTSLQSNITQRSQMTTPLDLFRYNMQIYTGAIRDMAYGNWGGMKGFSLDKGTTALGYFSTGAITQNFGGDGQQASHWSSGGIMAPTLAPGARPWITNLDLRAMDVIGWDVNLAPTINLSTLRSQAISALATRAGQTTTWVTNNLNNSPTPLVADRNTDVNTMLTNSQIYNWGNNAGDGAWQKIFSLMTLQGVFSTLDELDSAVSVKPSETAGKVLTQVDLQALVGSQVQQPISPTRSFTPIQVEPLPSIAPIEVAPLSLSTPVLKFEFRSLDAAKAWTMGEKRQLSSSNPEAKTVKQQVLLSSAIDE